MKATKADLENIEIEVNPNGFTVWVKETDGKKHWILDGSCIKEDGEIRIGGRNLYELNIAPIKVKKIWISRTKVKTKKSII